MVRKPLAQRLWPFVEHLCKRFVCRKPLAEMLKAIAETLYANAGMPCEADERIAEESRGHREFAVTSEPSPRTLDARGQRPILRVGTVHKSAGRPWLDGRMGWESDPVRPPIRIPTSDSDSNRAGVCRSAEFVPLRGELIPR